MVTYAHLDLHLNPDFYNKVVAGEKLALCIKNKKIGSPTLTIQLYYDLRIYAFQVIVLISLLLILIFILQYNQSNVMDRHVNIVHALSSIQDRLGPSMGQVDPNAGGAASGSGAASSSGASGSANPPAAANASPDPDTHRGAYCVICWTAPRTMAFSGCGHVCCCSNCAQRLKLCPVCRSPTKKKMRVYFP